MNRILLIDDHILTRIGTRSILEQESNLLIVGEAPYGLDVCRLCKELSPELLLMDFRISGPTPTMIVRLIQQNCSQIKIVILTDHDTESDVRCLVSSGIHGYILKSEAPEKILHAVRVILEGEHWFSCSILSMLAKRVPTNNDLNLTEREQQVIELLAKGYKNDRIATMLFIAEGTVKNHIVNIYDKLGVHSRAEAVAWFWQHTMNNRNS